MDLSVLREFLETPPVAMLGAWADAQLEPEAFRLWGATVDEQGLLRALASSEAGRTLAGLRAGGRVSCVFTDITSFRSMQVKGAAVGAPEAPGPADVALLRRYDEPFCAALESIGHPPLLAQRLRPVAVFVLRVAVDELYDQTPGPGAGSAIGVLRG